MNKKLLIGIIAGVVAVAAIVGGVFLFRHKHTEVIDPAVAPTCTETGLTEGKHCSECGEVIIPQNEISTIDHIEGNWIIDIEPTITSEGKRHISCIVCGKIIKTEILYATTSEGLEYALNKNGTSYSVVGIGSCSDTDIVIPNTYNDLPVVTIYDNAFKRCTWITSITMGNNIQWIGDYVFEECTNLQNVTIGDSVKNIGIYAFRYCTSLTNVTIPNSVTNIDGAAFAGCTSLTNIILGDSVTSIGNMAFRDCTSLTSITIGNSVTSIGDGAFDNCVSLVDVYYKGDVKDWLKITYVYGGHDSPMSYATNLYFNEELVTNVTIPDSITNIGDGAFFGCDSLTSVTIGENVVNIAYNAFLNCISLVEVCNKSSLNITVGSSDNGYVGCYAKHIITDESQSAIKTVGDYIFYDDGTDIYLVKYLGNDTEITLPEYDGGKEYGIWNCTFYQNETIISVIIPDSVTSIGHSTFYGCSALTSITIPDFVKSIGYRAFDNCSSLANITLGNSMANIGGRAFWGCDSLTSINIPNSVTSIGDSAFADCTSLEKVSIGASVNSIGNYVFSGCTSLINIDVNINNQLYRSINGNLYSKDEQTLIEYAIGKKEKSFMIPESVTSIGEYAFAGCASLTSITIPDSVKSIGSSAFSGCTSLTSVTIGDSVTSIGNSAFYNCSSLTSITIPDSINDIADDSFAGCTSLQYNEYDNALYLGNKNNPYVVLFGVKDEKVTSIETHKNTKLIHNLAFNGCSITNLTFNGNIPIYKYSKINSLTSITIGDFVTSIDDAVFYFCKSLTSVTIGNSVISIGDDAFGYCASLTSITIPDSVTSIGDSAFAYCASLTNVIIGNSVTSIGIWAFHNCTSLTNVTIGDSVTSIGRYAFEGCSSLSNISVSDSINKYINLSGITQCISIRYNEYDNALYLGNENNPYVILIKSKDDEITTCEVHSDTKMIYYYAFYNCTSLTSVTIGNSVKNIGNDAFRGCSSLTSINIPDSVTSIGDWAFGGCRKLTSITIPDSVTSIGECAFSGCSSLTSITIPDSITSIGERAFSGCSSLTIYCEAESKPSGWSSSWNYSKRPVVWGYKPEQNN